MHSKAQYGTYTYGTDCGRFQLFKNTATTATETAGTWEIIESSHHEYNVQWYQWLIGNGLWEAVFDTRQATLEALAYALNSDGLMDAHQPW